MEIIGYVAIFAIGFALGSAVEPYRQHRRLRQHKNQVLSGLDRISETLKKKISDSN